MEIMKSRQCEYIFKVRIYFEATGFSYELNVGCETEKRKSKMTMRFLTKQNTGLLFKALGKMVKAGLGEYWINLDMLNLTKLFRHLSGSIVQVVGYMNLEFRCTKIPIL